MAPTYSLAPLRRVQGEGYFIRRAERGLSPFLCRVLYSFDPRTPTHNPPLSVTIHQGAAILADGSGEDKMVSNIIIRSQKIGRSDVKAFN